MRTPTRLAGAAGAHNLNADTPYRTPTRLAGRGTVRAPRGGSHSTASSSTRGTALCRAGATASTVATPPAQGLTGAYESPLPTRPTRNLHGDYQPSSGGLFSDQGAPLLSGGGGFDDDDDELFSRYSDYYYDPHAPRQAAENHHPLDELGSEAADVARRSSLCARWCGGAGSCARGVLLLVNILVLLASGAALMVGLLARQSLQDSLKSLCHDCTRLYNVYVVCTMVLVVTAVWGCIMLLVGRRLSSSCVLRCGDECTCHVASCCRRVYMIVLVCVLAMLAWWLLAYTLVLRGDLNLSEAWDLSITANDTKVCYLEYRLECSGWEDVCPAVTPAPSTMRNNPRAMVVTALVTPHMTSTPKRLQRTLCPHNCPEYMQAAINTFQRPCAPVVKHLLRSRAYVLLVPSAVMAAAMLLSLVTVCVTARCTPSMASEEPTDFVARRYGSSSARPRMAVSVVEA